MGEMLYLDQFVRIKVCRILRIMDDSVPNLADLPPPIIGTSEMGRIYLKTLAGILFEHISLFLWRTCGQCQKPQKYAKCSNIRQHGLKVFQDHALLRKTHKTIDWLTIVYDLELSLSGRSDISGFDVISWMGDHPNYQKWSYVESEWPAFSRCIEDEFKEKCKNGTIFDFVKEAYKNV